ncbi:MAG: hypothetical protein JEZ07_16225 [Phycisphaerae bacterium]|nr:hypothetical protein [Phycisphaerae bacterium]
MKTINILIFEDEPYRYENIHFIKNLKGKLSQYIHTNIDIAMNIGKFEKSVNSSEILYDCIVLDIMGKSHANFKWLGSDKDKKESVPDSLVGIELLWRLKKGSYKEHYKSIPIFMRSARSERDLYNFCTGSDMAEEYYSPGTEDETLIQHISDILKIENIIVEP